MGFGILRGHYWVMTKATLLALSWATQACAQDFEDHSSEEVAELCLLAAELIRSYDEGFERDEVAYGLTAFER